MKDFIRNSRNFLAIISVLSVGGAHYLGFAVNLPTPVRNALGTSYATMFLTNFGLLIAFSIISFRFSFSIISLEKFRKFLVIIIHRLRNLDFRRKLNRQDLKEISRVVKLQRKLVFINLLTSFALTVPWIMYMYIGREILSTSIIIFFSTIGIIIFSARKRIKHSISSALGAKNLSEFLKASYAIPIVVASVIYFSYTLGSARFRYLALGEPSEISCMKKDLWKILAVDGPTFVLFDGSNQFCVINYEHGFQFKSNGSAEDFKIPSF